MQFDTFPQKIQNRCTLHPCEDEKYSSLFVSLTRNRPMILLAQLFSEQKNLLLNLVDRFQKKLI